MEAILDHLQYCGNNCPQVTSDQIDDRGQKLGWQMSGESWDRYDMTIIGLYLITTKGQNVQKMISTNLMMHIYDAIVKI